MKKYLSLLIIFFCIFLCGCNQKKDTRTILKFSTWGSRTEYSILTKVIEEYEKNNPNIKIELIHVPENYFRKLHILYAAKTAPDVVFVNNTYAPLYIRADLLENLNGYFDESQFYKSSIDCFKYDNNLYAIPRDISNLVLYINKNIVKHPEKIKTVNDLRNIAKEVSKNGIFGLNYEKNPLFWLYFLEYFNGGILTDDGKNVILNSEESIKGLILYRDMINQDNSIPKNYQMSSMTSAQMFINGQLAMYLGGRWMVPKFRETIKFDWDIIPFPQTQISKNLTDASGWAISKSSENKEEAINFIKYMSSEKVIKEFTKTGLITPARIDAANSKEFLSPNLKPKNSKVFTDILLKSKPTPVNSSYSKIIDETTKIAEKIFNNNINPNEILDEKIIQKLQKYCDEE